MVVLVTISLVLFIVKNQKQKLVTSQQSRSYEDLVLIMLKFYFDFF